MTGKRDIERTLDAWFVDGPSVMPDRLFDAVLDQVERTPQRPFARLRLRLTVMNPRIGWLAAAAAGLIFVIVALATINRPADDSVGASSTPLVSPSSPAADIPTELRSVWMGGPRPLPGLDADGGVTLTLSAADFEMSQSAGTPAVRFVSTAIAAGQNEFHVTTGTSATGCPEGATGRYTWSLSASGQTLEIVADEDTCAERMAAVPGTYWRMDCQTADNNCLGPVDAGTYSSQFFDPYLLPEDDWSPRYGALTYTVPDAWLNVDDFPGFYGLAPVGASDGTAIFIVSDVVVAESDSTCSEDADPDIGTTASDITDWLTTADGLVASTPEAVTIGGLEGFRVDVTIDPAWTETCPWTEGAPARNLFTDRPPDPGWSWIIVPDEPMRLYFLDVGGDRAVMIDIEALKPADYDGFVDEATTIVESFVFAP